VVVLTSIGVHNGNGFFQLLECVDDIEGTPSVQRVNLMTRETDHSCSRLPRM